MIRRQCVVEEFFEEAGAMREVLDVRFRDAYADRIPWYYFCEPRMYTYLRTAPQNVFPEPVFARFMQRLRSWCMEHLGLTPMGLPYLHLMVNGCRLGLHSDFHNGVWGYVYSLTRWEKRAFTGGETLLLRDGMPSYKRHHVHGDVLYELIPAQFNQLLIFDDRIVHATPTIEGSMDPMDGRIAMVGHIRATSPVVTGDLSFAQTRESVGQLLRQVKDQFRVFKEVQGTITFRLEIRPTGRVGSIATLTDNLVTQISGYEPSEAVNSAKSILRQALSELQFPRASGTSLLVLPVLLPVPDLRPIEFAVAHNRSRDLICEWARTSLPRYMDLQGVWEGGSFTVQEPLIGSIRVDTREICFAFEPPMWVPSQRESFEAKLREWASALPAGR